VGKQRRFTYMFCKLQGVMSGEVGDSCSGNHIEQGKEVKRWGPCLLLFKSETRERKELDEEGEKRKGGS